jgi:hypothetical protein
MAYACDIGITMTVEQRGRIQARAEREGRSLSVYVARVIVKRVRG